MMHFEILVEDPSGKKALDILMPKALKNNPWYVIGKEKSAWAEKITPYMHI
jgi:hypothetical protein